MTKVDKIKTVKAIYKGLKILDSSCDVYSVINQMAADGFSFSNPNDLKKLIKLVSLARGAASDVKISVIPKGNQDRKRGNKPFSITKF